MMQYVDGFVLVVPKKKLNAYRRMAARAGQVWRQHGCLDYKECVGDDLKIKRGVPFPKMAKAKSSDVVVFSYIVYKSKAHRDKVNAKVMKDLRIKAMMTNDKETPFDMKKMSYGGFKVIVNA